MRQLMVKDWYLARHLLAINAVAGLGTVALLQLRTEVSGFVGLSGALIVLVFQGILMPMNSVVQERKRQNLPFVMSLPVSPMEYTTAKIIANLVGFALLWLVLTAGVLATFQLSGAFGGLIPIALVAALSPFVAFCLILATAIVLESEQWSIGVMSACNVSYSLAWFFLVRSPAIRAGMRSPVPIWSQPILTILFVEVALIVLAVALTFFFQSRKTDFI